MDGRYRTRTKVIRLPSPVRWDFHITTPWHLLPSQWVPVVIVSWMETGVMASGDIYRFGQTRVRAGLLAPALVLAQHRKGRKCCKQSS